jgi:transketolase
LQATIDSLKAKALIIRRDILTMITEAGSGHPGGSLSAVEIVVALYFEVMHIDPFVPGWPDRDRFVLSKGHAAPLLYSVLAERGYFGVAELKTLRKLGGLQGHPCYRTPGVDASTGSLGQGLAIANGLALAGRLDGKDYRVYALLGDGETQEGMVWEAAMAAAHYRLGNLTAIVDHNRLQIDGAIADVMSPEPLAEKWAAFGWNVQVVDGHDFRQILEAFNRAARSQDKPQVIIAETVKGKGISFMENQVKWHGSAPSRQQLQAALAELEEVAP